MDGLIDSADQVRGDERECQATIEIKRGWPPVELQIKAWLPRTIARITRRERAELCGEAGLCRIVLRREQLRHAGCDCGVGGGGRIEDERAIVARAVAVDIRTHEWSERRAGGESRNRCDLETRGQRMRDGEDDVVLAAECARRPF